MRPRLLKIMSVLFIGLWLSASMCTKVVVYGKDERTDAVSKTYKSNLRLSMLQAQKALESLGYEVSRVDNQQHQILTGWAAVLSDSHYKHQFNRRDYSASQGAYYQLQVDIVEYGDAIKVSVHTNVKSLIGDLSTSQVVENKFLKRLSDFMRSPQIQMTNVGVTER